MMKLAIAVGGTDLGRSGIGAYLRAILPRLGSRLRAAGGRLIALGTEAELAVYRDVLDGAERVSIGSLWQSPAANALWHLVAAGPAAARAGAEVLLLPAANRRAAARSPIPTVAVVHDVAPLLVRGKYDRLRTAYVRHLVIGALARADEIIAVSDATLRDTARALERDAARLRVVSNGVDHARFTPASEDDPRVRAARQQTKLSRPYVLYLARLEHPGKNHVRLLRAFRESRASRSHVLALAGADWGALPRIQAEIERLGLEDRVALLGYVPDAIVPGLVAGADAVVMVGLHEGFGLPALEALSAGRPLAIARAGALPEVAGELAASCDPEDPRSIAAAIDRALEDEALRARTRREGPARARARSWDVTAGGLLDACVQARELRRWSPGQSGAGR